MSKVQVIEFMYPRVEENPDTLEIDLMDVRASDGLRIQYDFKRDGWSIQQPINEDTWKEVYFAQSWALEEESESI